MRSLRGSLLISSHRLEDPNFEKTVILVLAHDENGAFGVVLNRALDIRLSRLAEEIIGSDTPREGVLYRGGPCESAVLVLFDDFADGMDSGSMISPGLRFSGDRDVIERLLENTLGETRFFAGYSGWGPGQLEEEIEDDAWLVMPARREHIFANPEKLYPFVRTELNLGSRLSPKSFPKDLTHN